MSTIPAVMTDSDHYAMPALGWTCFFCGDTFTTPGGASDHFGGDMGETAACRIKFGDEMGLLMELRRAQEELKGYRTEDSEKDRELAAMRSRHALELRREEEKGYARGMHDTSAEASMDAARWRAGLENLAQTMENPHIGYSNKQWAKKVRAMIVEK